MKSVIFLSKKLILLFHEQLIQIYGGSYGVRDEKLLDSALWQPKTTFDGKYLHDNLMKMATAYGYHICNNHPFIDGNKRIALVAMDVFLQRNGCEITAGEKETFQMMMDLASGRLSKDDLAIWLGNNTSSLTIS
ncbi:death-on-curing family protein [Desulfoscipio gibsoniae DSM 7213]|uniref:Death-on-curing family protein n=1 Tax=Desulfoscipio gibsoniae DSM 7213 TaxID=767817 RepID=R4KIW8_9FIRM|nr:death-on-curing family protein [Desulfoscipio gibsoniae DSM 7213]